MIIKFPTGFYTDVIESISNGSITYLISNTEPPRTDLTYAKLPMGVLAAEKPPKNDDRIVRRAVFGDLIYSISGADRSDENVDSRQYEIGQILEFGSFEGKDVEPMLVSKTTEIQHDTNKLDYSAMGISVEDQQAIEEIALATQITLMDRLNELKLLRFNADTAINNNQKLINELTKTIDSLTIALSEAPSYSSLSTELTEVEDIIAKLSLRRDEAFKARDDAISKANFYATESTNVTDKLRAVGIIVK